MTGAVISVLSHQKNGYLPNLLHLFLLEVSLAGVHHLAVPATERAGCVVSLVSIGEKTKESVVSAQVSLDTLPLLFLSLHPTFSTHT